MSTSSGRPSGCSTSSAARRERPEAWEIICLLAGFRNAADEGTLPDPRAVRARAVIDLVTRMELARFPRVVAHVSAGATATSPSGFGARAAVNDSGDDHHQQRA